MHWGTKKFIDLLYCDNLLYCTGLKVNPANYLRYTYILLS